MIYEYPIDLVFEFYKTGMFNYRSQIKDIAIAMRVAGHAKPEDFKEYIGDEKLIQKSVVSKPQKKEANKLKSLFRGFLSGNAKRNR